MTTSTSFTGYGLSLQSVSVLSANRLRVFFSSDPLQFDASAGNDGLNPANYSLVGPASVSIVGVSVVIGDTQALDISTSVVLPAGTWTLTVANIQTPTLSGLVAPVSSTFQTSASANTTPLSAGAETDTAVEIIRKHLSSAMKGPNWDALIEGLAWGDTFNFENAKAAFNQLFKSSASEKYLDRLASNDGLSRPKDVGMSDELFRKLSIAITNNKLTHQSLREILEVFYGEDSTRAFVETELAEPFALNEGQVFDWMLDENQSFSVTFDSSAFTFIDQAQAIEIAAVLNKAMSDVGSHGYAKSYEDFLTGQTKLRIYSGSVGLKSFARVTGGTAQPYLRFPDFLNVYGANDVVVGDGYSWFWTVPSQGVSKMTLTAATASLKVNLWDVQEGDYLVVGVAVGMIPSGTYVIKDVAITTSGPNTIQSATIEGEVSPQNIVQTSNYNYQFFRPTKNSILNGDRTVVVAQTEQGVDITIPATTQAVNRTNSTAAYGQQQPEIEVDWLRKAGSTVKFSTSTPHGLQAGDSIVVSGVGFSPELPGNSPSGGFNETAGSYGTCWSALTDADAPPINTEDSRGCVAGAGALVIAGGFAAGALSAETSRFELGATIPVTGANNVEGSVRWGFDFIPCADMSTARKRFGFTPMINGRLLASGGDNSWGSFGVTSACEIFNPTDNDWDATGAMATARCDHIQAPLSTGKVLVAGGTSAADNATNTAELFDVSVGTWSAAASMLQARSNHKAVVLNDGRVFVTGGQVLGSGGASRFGDHISVYTPTSATLSTTEIYDPLTNVWLEASGMAYTRSHHHMFVLDDGRVLVFGGSGKFTGYPGANLPLKSMEIFDPVTGHWVIAGNSLTAWVDSNAVMLPGKRQIVVTYSKGTDELSHDVLNLDTMKWSTHYLPSTERRDRAYTVENDFVVMTGGGLADIGARVPGQDTLSSSGINGVHVVESVLGSTFTIQTPDNQGFMYSDSTHAVVVPMAAPTSSFAGPYAYDRFNGVTVTATQTTLVSGLLKGQNYDTIALTDSTGFESSGYLTLGFGTAKQSKPMKYLRKLSGNLLVLDFRQEIEFDYSPGDTVDFLLSRNPYAPESTLGQFWLTASSSGRIAAQQLCESSVAAGVSLDFTVVYPGDKGLGGAGYPTENATKLSDIVKVFGE